MPENLAPSREKDIWGPTRTDAVVLAIGVVFVGVGALVTMILPSTPGWTFLADFGLTAGVAIALIGVLLRFQLRIESELKRLGEAIDEQAERTRRLEGQSVKLRPARQYPPGQEHGVESKPLVRRRDPVTHKSEATKETKGRGSSLTSRLQEWWDSAQRPYRPPKPPREPLLHLPGWLTRAIENVLLGVAGLTSAALGLGILIGGIVVTFVISTLMWGALLSAVGLWHWPASGVIGDNGVVMMMLAGSTTAALAGLATWSWAELRLPIAIAAAMTTLVGLAVAQYGFGAFG
jgi:hypothetical protein